MTHYVDKNASDFGNGTREKPFNKIQSAAEIAVAGDEIIVAPGIYRESVNPKNGGTKEKPIIYKSQEPLKAHITGAEELKNWEKVEGDVYRTSVSNSIFGNFNPYKELVSGDWFIAYMTAHLGDVFLNEKSMYEVQSLDEVKKAEISPNSWEREFSRYKWFAEQDEKNDKTIFYANFQGKNPNEENVEFSVRKNCICPSEEGRNYITISGFTVSKAASQWAPPTAYQEGMIDVHWSKGWIIEDCHIYEAKTNGISLGKYLQKTNNNKWLKTKYKDGTQTQRECVCLAQKDGWTKEKIGSHTIRRCEIHNCGQTGIVGHLGGVFSLIEENHIHHINNKQNLAGAEIGGIKMHAAIDCVYRKNHIHHCTRGIWLDWQAQGTRVTQNLFHDNALPNEYNQKLGSDSGIGEDLFIEVSHGPTLLDNNIFLSQRALKLPAQGIAMVHNLVAGSFVAIGIGTDNGAPTRNSARYTPYHFPHQTEVAGWMTFLHGDCKFYNNIFVQQEISSYFKERMEKSPKNCWDDNYILVGTKPFEFCPTFEEWDKMFEGYCGMGSETTDRYYSELPVWYGKNVYLGGAEPSSKDTDSFVDKTSKIELKLEEKDGKLNLKTNIFEIIKNHKFLKLKTNDIPEAFESEQKYENADGSEIVFNEEFMI